MIKLEGAVTEKMVSLNKRKIVPAMSEASLFIYFDKQSFALIIHANACSERSVPTFQPAQCWVLWEINAKTPSPAFLELFFLEMVL